MRSNLILVDDIKRDVRQTARHQQDAGLFALVNEQWSVAEITCAADSADSCATEELESLRVRRSATNLSFTVRLRIE